MVSNVRQGEVYWLNFGPASGSHPAERHPCVVVQGDIFNQSRIATTVVCLITSNLDRAKAVGNVLLRRGDAHLPKASVVNVSQILTVDKADLIDPIGKLSATTVRAIWNGLQALLEGPLSS